MFVCLLLFVSRCMGPEGPWQRRLLYILKPFPDPDQLARSWWGAPPPLPCVPCPERIATTKEKTKGILQKAPRGGLAPPLLRTPPRPSPPPLPIAPPPCPVRPLKLRVALAPASCPPWCRVGTLGPPVLLVGLGRVSGQRGLWGRPRNPPQSFATSSLSLASTCGSG